MHRQILAVDNDAHILRYIDVLFCCRFDSSFNCRKNNFAAHTAFVFHLLNYSQHLIVHSHHQLLTL